MPRVVLHLNNRIIKCANSLYYLFWRCLLPFFAYVFICLPFQHLVDAFGAAPEFIGTLFFTIAFFSILFLGLGFYTKKIPAQAWWIPIFIFVLALILRLCAIYFIGQGTTQVSDFMMAFQASQKKVPLNEPYYAIFSPWCMYSFYLKVIFKIFGTSELTGIVANAFLEAGSAVLIYFLVLLTLQEKHTSTAAVAAALLYAMWPMQLIYLVLLSPEFVHIFIMLLGLVFLVLAQRQTDNGHEKRAIIEYGISAFCICFSGFFKSVDKVMLIALFFVYFIFFCLDCKYSKKLEISVKPGFGINRLLHFGPIAFIITYLIVNAIGFRFLDYYIVQPVDRNPAPHFLNIGLRSETQGEWNAAVASEYIAVVTETDYDYDAAAHIIMESIRQDVAENKHINVQFFLKKLARAWKGQDYLYFAYDTIEKNNRIYTLQIENQIFYQSYYLGVGILTVVGCWFFMHKKPTKFYFSIALFVLGFILLLLISEIQPRYKVITYPYICILAGVGFNWCLESINYERNHKSNILQEK